MSGLIDLHVHTTASDGTMTPEQVVFHAAQCGLQAIAVTDHDTIDGVEEALAAGVKAGVEVVPGVEISVDYLGEMHILGYFIEPQNPELQGGLARLRHYRNERNPQIIKKLRDLRFDISIDEVSKAANGNVIGRPHFAAVLKQKGYVRDFNQAFDWYLGEGRPAYVKKERLTPRQGIEMVAAAGGIPVLAHPKYLKVNDSTGLEELIRELKGYGLKGIEALYTTHSSGETGKFCDLALKCELLITGGSDFHGSNKPEIEIGRGEGGLTVQYELLERLKAKR
ncbi:MAG: PHP domain-containing protein [Eubacteriales bacterium]